MLNCGCHAISSAYRARPSVSCTVGTRVVRTRVVREAAGLPQEASSSGGGPAPYPKLGEGRPGYRSEVCHQGYQGCVLGAAALWAY